MNKKNNIITYNDPLIFRKKKQIDETVLLTEEGFPMPSVVEISESGMCNRKCVFCPRSDPDYNHVNEFISPKLVDKLTKQLSSLDYENLIFDKPTILFSQNGKWKIEMENSSNEINFKDTLSVPVGVNINIEINETEDSYLNCVSSI